MMLDSWTYQQLEDTVHFFAERRVPAYLVGGSLRNLLMGEVCIDWDIVTNHEAHNIARHLANRLNGFYAHMNTRASRVILKREQGEVTIDMSPLQGRLIEDDLQKRDFTVNALAIPLADLLPLLHNPASTAMDNGTPSAIIDPTGGLNDLRERILRLASPTAFKQDPLRMLRAIRFMARYGMQIEPDTARQIKEDAPLITSVASERIHSEISTILQPAGSIQHLHFIQEQGLLDALIPELAAGRGMPQPSLHHWDVLEHSLETVAKLEYLDKILHQSPQELRDSPLDVSKSGAILTLQQLLQEADEEHLFSIDDIASIPMKIGALLHDVGKPPTYAVNDDGNITFYYHPQAGIPLAQQITRRLGFNTQERHLIQQLVAHHMRPGQLSNNPVTQRAIRRYFVDLGPHGINVALISLADHLAMRGPEPLTEHWERHLTTVCLLLKRYIREREQILPPRIIQADELMHRLHLESGPIVGELLEAIAEAQAEGEIHSKEEALWLVEERLQQMQV